MNMRGITDQEHATDTVAIRQPRIHVEGRCPGHRLDANIIAAGARGRHCGEPFGGEVDVAFERDRRLQLEQLGSGERA
jgi:hypothetical protein